MYTYLHSSWLQKYFQVCQIGSQYQRNLREFIRKFDLWLNSPDVLVAHPSSFYNCCSLFSYVSTFMSQLNRVLISLSSYVSPFMSKTNRVLIFRMLINPFYLVCRTIWFGYKTLARHSVIPFILSSWHFNMATSRLILMNEKH